MGWEGIFSNKKEIDVIKEELLNGCEVHYHHRKGNVFYLAVSTNSNPGFILGVVILYKKVRGSTEQMFKIMDETVGPCYYDANKKLLSLLTPTGNKWANEWREECYKSVNEKSALIKSSKKVEMGTYVRFKDELRFSDGSVRTDFIYRGKNRFSVPDYEWDLYRITKWKEREFKILKEKNKVYTY